MATAEEFDEFYVATRRRVVLQTVVLTGDLATSRTAVRDAYVAARHHWRKVAQLPDPESWVRSRAWAIAQRRHTVRPWRREKDLTDAQSAVLHALDELPDVQRKTLVLTHLAALPMADIGREVGLTQQRTEQHLQAATAAVAIALDCDSTAIRPQLETLAPLAETATLPRAPIVRRSGVRRRRVHALGGAALAVLVTLGAGALVVTPPGDEAAATARSLVGKRMLLTPAALAGLAADRTWKATGTSDNTDGTGINTMCQTTRFADPHGVGTWVRTFRADGSPPSGVVQTVEISGTPGDAETAYDTTLGWYAGCEVARMQLVDSYQVTGIGDRAQVLRMRIPDRQTRSFLVGIVRTGSLTTSTVLEVHADKPPRAETLLPTLATSVRKLCDSPVAGTCVSRPALTETLPPASGEQAGMLAIADLPVIPDVDFPWAGTEARVTAPNVAATTCDRSDFVKAGAVDPVSRTFLIPQADLPKRFGLSETIGRLPDVASAKKFVNRVVRSMRGCPDRELGSTISTQRVVGKGPADSEYAFWRLENEVQRKLSEVDFWMGVVRVGPWVGQVTFTPVPEYDVRKGAFKTLLERARDRLREVAG